MMRSTAIKCLLALFMLSTMGVQASDDPRDLPYDVPTILEGREEYQWTPLHWAVRRAQVDRIDELRRHIEARDFQGRTPLHIAVLSGHDEVVRALLAAGANVNSRDQWGITPLRRAKLVEEHRRWDRANIIRILRDAGGETKQIMP